MRLVELRLTDLRRFGDLRVGLAGGINLLSGPNGAGKTTVIEAIGFALFGVPPTRGADGDPTRAVRDGEDELKVEATFEHGAKTYTVTRTLSAAKQTAKLREGTRTKPIAGDPQAVGNHLAGLLRLSRPEALPVLFRRLVGIDQGEITRPFLLGAEARAEYFRPLLNLDRYEEAARSVAAVGQAMRAELQLVETERAEGKGELKAYQGMVNRVARCGEETTAARERAARLGERLGQLATEADGLEARRTRVHDFTVEAAVLDEAERGRAVALRQARARLDEAETAKAVVDRTQKAAERFEWLETECRALELRSSEYDDLRAEVESLDRRLVAGRQQTDGARDELHASLDANEARTAALMAERDTQRDHLDTLRSALRQTEGTHNGLTLALARADRLHKPLAGIPPPVRGDGARGDGEAVRRERDAGAAELAAATAADLALNAELATLRARAATQSDARGLLNEARATLREREAAKDGLDRTLAALAPAHGACPILRAPCSNIGGASLIDHFTGEGERLQTGIASAREAIRFAEARLADAVAARGELERKEIEARAAAAKRASPRTERPTQPTTRSGTKPGPKTDFNELAHHLSGLAGILGAIEPPAAANQPIALIGAIAGVGETTTRATARIQLPDLAELELATSLAHQGRQANDAPPSTDRDERAQRLAVELADLVRRIHAAVTLAEAQARALMTRLREQARLGDEALRESSRELERLALDRTRIREAAKRLSTDDLGLLDLEIALSERRIRLGALARLENDLASRRREQESLSDEHAEYQAHGPAASRVEADRDELHRLEAEQARTGERAVAARASLAEATEGFDDKALTRIVRDRERMHAELGEATESVRSLEREGERLQQRLLELAAVAAQMEELEAARATARAGSALADELAATYRAMADPVGAAIVGQVGREANRLYRMVTRGSARLAWASDFGLALVEPTGPRPFAELARGEQVTAAIAVILALLEQFPDLGLLLLDEPTAHLDENHRHGLVAAIAAFRRVSAGHVQQLVVVAHDDAFDQIAEHHVRLGAAPG